jgi:hypothetical protein
MLKIRMLAPFMTVMVPQSKPSGAGRDYQQRRFARDVCSDDSGGLVSGDLAVQVFQCDVGTCPQEIVFGPNVYRPRSLKHCKG